MPGHDYGTGTWIIGAREMIAAYFADRALLGVTNGPDHTILYDPLTNSTFTMGIALVDTPDDQGMAPNTDDDNYYIAYPVWEGGLVTVYQITDVALTGITGGNEILTIPDVGSISFNYVTLGALATEAYGSTLSPTYVLAPSDILFAPYQELGCGDGPETEGSVVAGASAGYDIPALYMLSVRLVSPSAATTYAMPEIAVCVAPWAPPSDQEGAQAAWGASGLPDWVLQGTPPPGSLPTMTIAPIVRI